MADGLGSGAWEKYFDQLKVVKQASDLSGTLSSTTIYFIDGIIDMGSQSIEVPAGGLSLSGHNFDVSKLTSSAVGYTMFTSPAGGSGNLVGKDYAIEVTGAGSQVYNITSNTGFDAFEFARINYNGCTSLGTITNYRQGFETGTGRFGGSPNLTLAGTWVGGYFIDSCIVRSLDAGMTGALFQAGAGFSMSSRFRSNMNVDLPASAAYIDFAPSNFPNPSTVQLAGMILSRNGAFNPNDSNLTPNISASELECSWVGNVGLENTFVGGSLEVTSETATVIAVPNVFVDLAGTWSPQGLQHYTQTGAGDPGLRHDGSSPREFLITYDLVIDGTVGDEIEIGFVVDDGVSPTLVSSQIRPINSLLGGRDVAFFNKTFPITINQGDEVFLQVSNITAARNVTAETSSFFLVTER